MSIERDSQTTQVWNYTADFLKTMINILNNLQVNMDEVDEEFQERFGNCKMRTKWKS